MLDGLNETPASETTLIESVALVEADPNVAVIFAEVALDTCVVEIVKVLVAEPAGMTTLDGTDAVCELLFRRTLTPPVGA